ncbi:unnamed protein product [Orchesella dallaii]|uniref:Uncharacterized protein n=1 Tax=Orchesella dallaii TaxID=48710 RepID=A0ABP1PTQ8_9HEXA
MDKVIRAETARLMLRGYIEAIPAAKGKLVADQGQSENEVVSPLVTDTKRQREKLREKVKRSGGKIITLFEPVAGSKVGRKNSSAYNVTQINDYEAVAVCAVLENISEIAKFIICPQATEERYVGVCPKCPNEEKFEMLFQYVSDEEIRVKFRETKPITVINEQRMHVEEFNEKFHEVLNTFMRHKFTHNRGLS